MTSVLPSKWARATCLRATCHDGSDDTKGSGAGAVLSVVGRSQWTVSKISVSMRKRDTFETDVAQCWMSMKFAESWHGKNSLTAQMTEEVVKEERTLSSTNVGPWGWDCDPVKPCCARRWCRPHAHVACPTPWLL